MHRYRIYYMKPDHFRTFSCGVKFVEKGILPKKDSLERTHTFLKELNAENFEDVFVMMQADNWSPYGEGRRLIRSKGLCHTSMTVGDIIETECGDLFMVDSIGFYKL